METMLGIDISDEDWIRELLELNDISSWVDMEQGFEQLKVGKGLGYAPTFDLSVPSGQNRMDRFTKGKLKGSQ